MTRRSIILGYQMDPKEDPPGVWSPESVIEKTVKGDILRASVINQNGDRAIDDLNINNQISIVMDSFVRANTHNLKYIVLYDTRWEIRSMSINRPRLVLTVGGVYNGPTPND